MCDACKETEENDNEIVDNLCKNDFGKFSFTLLPLLTVNVKVRRISAQSKMLTGGSVVVPY